MSRRAVLWAAAAVAGIVLLALGPANAQTPLRYSCSAQVFEAFDVDRLEAFTAKTGIPVELHVTSSNSALQRLMNDMADIASSTEPLYHRHREYGYVEIPFCRDPLVVITHPGVTVREVSSTRLRDIFSRVITRWSELGGADEPIVIIVPGKNTAAFKNFDSQVMQGREIVYDLMTYESTFAIKTVRRFNHSISFISQAAASKSAGVKIMDIGGFPPGHELYPYSQTLSFVTKGHPKGAAAAFIDFVFSPEGIELIEKNGMIPLPRP